jgi:AcrR family transcriptional regulator
MMPKPTFFNLPKEKQDILLNVAKKEFSRVSLYEASISNIIKEAGIPRGSFYQYFEDKEDVFFYLLDVYSKRTYDKFISILKKNNGDIFESFIEWFKSVLKSSEIPEDRQYIKNAFLNMNYKIEKAFTQNVYGERVKSRFYDIVQLIDVQKLNVKSEKDIYHIFKIMMAVTMQNLVHAIARELPANEAIKNYTLEMDLLKRGCQGDGSSGSL